MAYQAGQLIQERFIISHCYGRHSPLLVVGQNISVKHSALYDNTLSHSNCF
ncbi:hypothetical protein GY307_001927 [Salmonella enterica]|nr:hypothetical protein [Salmonella enterica]EEI9070407.1 hypothetical protein [Salmonella enterica subsp. enterica serovar Saintpaul]